MFKIILNFYQRKIKKRDPFRRSSTSWAFLICKLSKWYFFVCTNINFSLIEFSQIISNPYRSDLRIKIIFSFNRTVFGTVKFYIYKTLFFFNIIIFALIKTFNWELNLFLIRTKQLMRIKINFSSNRIVLFGLEIIFNPNITFLLRIKIISNPNRTRLSCCESIVYE